MVYPADWLVVISKAIVKTFGPEEKTQFEAKLHWSFLQAVVEAVWVGDVKGYTSRGILFLFGMKWINVSSLNKS